MKEIVIRFKFVYDKNFQKLQKTGKNILKFIKYPIHA